MQYWYASFDRVCKRYRCHRTKHLVAGSPILQLPYAFFDPLYKCEGGQKRKLSAHVVGVYNTVAVLGLHLHM